MPAAENVSGLEQEPWLPQPCRREPLPAAQAVPAGAAAGCAAPALGRSSPLSPAARWHVSNAGFTHKHDT